MKDFKFFRENKPALWGYIPFPFECHYNFNGRDDLYNYEDITGNLTDRMIIDILNDFQEDDVLQYNDNVEFISIRGFYSDGANCIDIFVRHQDGATINESLELYKNGRN